MTSARFGRRHFVAGAAALGARLALPGGALAGAGGEVRVDVAIIGGSLGGYAALRALREEGLRVAITSPTAWFGGQLTSQGVPLDEHYWVEAIPGSRLYQEFRRRLRRWYRGSGGLTARAATTLWLNPGEAGVGRLAVEPRVAAAVIDEGLAEASQNGGVVALREYVPVRVERSGDRFDAVIVRPVAGGAEVALIARLFIDATDLGDLLDLGGVEHSVGAESIAQTGEPGAPLVADPRDQQAITWSFAAEYCPAPAAPVARPASYDYWRAFRPALTPDWPGPLFSWTYTDPLRIQPITGGFVAGQFAFLGYRRVRAPRHFAAGGNEITIVNWPQNDYFVRPLVGPGVTEAGRRLAIEEARELSRSFLHWLQTEAPRDNGGVGYPELQPRPDALGTADGFAMQPYFREGRRIAGLVTVTAQQIGRMTRQRLGLPTDRATVFADSVGIGHYALDLHPSVGGRNYRHEDALPYQIPWGALVPRRVENLLAVGLSIATTHLTNGAYRTHATEFATGVAAGYGAALCLERGATPAQVWAVPALLAELQGRLVARGVTLAWPASMTAFTDVPQLSNESAAIWCLADQGIIRGYSASRFAPADTVLRAQVAALLCRLLGWDNESWPTPFSDRDGLSDDLWRAVGTLAGRGVAKGFADGTFGPNRPVTKVQAISFIARAFVEAGRWAWQARPVAFPNLTAASGHRRDAETFVAYTGGLDECPYSESWPGAYDPAPRRWFAATLHLALQHPTVQD